MAVCHRVLHFDLVMESSVLELDSHGRNVGDCISRISHCRGSVTFTSHVGTDGFDGGPLARSGSPQMVSRRTPMRLDSQSAPSV